MKHISLGISALLLAVYSCKPGTSGDDNSHLRDSSSQAFPTKLSKQPDSTLVNGVFHYKLERDLMINGRLVSDTFILGKAISSLGKPDSIRRGGPEIRAEFGADDYTLYYGKSAIQAGHGYMLEIRARDKRLEFYTLRVGSSRNDVEKILRLDFPDKDTLKCIGRDEGVYYFTFGRSGKVKAIDYYAVQL